MRATEKYIQNIKPIIEDKPASNLGFIVTIPAFNEAETLKSLQALLDCDKPKCSVEVLVNINYSEMVSESEKHFNNTAFDILDRFAQTVSTKEFKIYILKNANQNPKKAGVGLARKQLMDEAYFRLYQIGNLNGVITGFDADSTCWSNYFTAIYDFFFKTKAKACSIKFAHPIDGDKFDAAMYKAVALYELHLRYFIYMQQQIGSPYAYQTIGSSFAVRAEAYAQVNGMSPNKAGEDFYFLQSLMALGQFYQLNTTSVLPSSRMSNRVGFGTGPSVKEISSSGVKNTFSYFAFVEIKKLFDYLPTYYEKKNFDDLKVHFAFRTFIQSLNIETICQKLSQNHKSYQLFQRAFLQWFNGFRILKALNALSLYPDFKQESIQTAVKYLDCIDKEDSFWEDLEVLRNIDSQKLYYSFDGCF